ncbi:MAG: pilin [Candidatus Dojkabacteria bacterium]
MATIGFLFPVSPIAAYTDPAEIAECERRNALNTDASCSIRFPLTPEECCPCDCLSEEKVCNNNGRCVTVSAGSLVATSTTTTLGLNIFPILSTSSGVIITDTDGNILVVETIANTMLWIFIAVGLVAVAFGLYGAFKYGSARDKDEEVEKASSILKNALLGFIIALASGFLVLLIAAIFDFDMGTRAPFTLTRSPAQIAQDEIDQTNFFNNIFR